MWLIRILRFLVISLPLIGLLSVVWPAASLVLWILGKSPDDQFQLARRWAQTLVYVIFVRVQIVGLENLKGLGPSVLAANHPSPLDVAILISCLPVNLRVFAARQLFFNPFLCFQLRIGGHLAGGRDSLKSLRYGIRLMTKARTYVLIFAEMPHIDGKLHEFQGGAALMAIRAGVPIVPIALTGTRQVSGGTVVVRIGEPIRTQGLHGCDRNQLTTCLHARVEEMLTLNGKMKSSKRTGPNPNQPEPNA